MPKLLIQKASLEECLKYLGFSSEEIIASRDAITIAPQKYYVLNDPHAFRADERRLHQWLDLMVRLREGFDDNIVSPELEALLTMNSMPVAASSSAALMNVATKGMIDGGRFWKKVHTWRKTLASLQEAYGQLYVTKDFVRAPTGTAGQSVKVILVEVGEAAIDTANLNDRLAEEVSAERPVLEFGSFYLGFTLERSCLQPHYANICLGTLKPMYPKAMPTGLSRVDAVRKWKAGKTYSDFIHPHACIRYKGAVPSHGLYGLCVGDLQANQEYKRAFLTGQLVKAVSMAAGLLSNWRFESHHLHSFSWTDYLNRCPQDRPGHKHFLVTRDTPICMGCLRTNCPKCIEAGLPSLDIRVSLFCQNGCSPKGIYFCEQCRTRSYVCTACRKTAICPSHRKSCEYCGRGICNKCYTERKCRH